MSSSLPQIGFAGLGNMGKYMATNLANALAASSPPRKLLVWNRTLSKAQDVARDTNGAAIPTDTATQLAQQCVRMMPGRGRGEGFETGLDEDCAAQEEKLVVFYNSRSTLCAARPSSVPISRM